MDIRDRIVSLIATTIFGIVTFAFLLFSLLNGAGAVLAHFDSNRLHAAQPCGSQGASSNCIAYETAVLQESFGGESFLLQFANGETALVSEANIAHMPTVLQPGNNARVERWNGKIVELVFDSEIVETTANPDWYSQTWPVTLTFGMLTLIVTAIVYVLTSWATGYSPFSR